MRVFHHSNAIIYYIPVFFGNMIFRISFLVQTVNCLNGGCGMVLGLTSRREFVCCTAPPPAPPPALRCSHAASSSVATLLLPGQGHPPLASPPRRSPPQAGRNPSARHWSLVLWAQPLSSFSPLRLSCLSACYQNIAFPRLAYARVRTAHRGLAK